MGIAFARSNALTIAFGVRVDAYGDARKGLIWTIRGDVVWTQSEGPTRTFSFLSPVTLERGSACERRAGFSSGRFCGHVAKAAQRGGAQ